MHVPRVGQITPTGPLRSRSPASPLFTLTVASS